MALEFVSSTPYVNLGSLSALSEASAFSISAWIKLAGTNADYMIAMRGAVFGTATPWGLWRDKVGSVSGRVNTLKGQVNTDAGSVRSEAASNLLNDIGSWRHVAMVFEAGLSDGLRLFVDGARDPNYASTVGHSSVETNTDEVTIGSQVSMVQFAGCMAEFSVWTDALSDTEIASLAQGFSPPSLPAAADRLLVYQ